MLEYSIGLPVLLYILIWYGNNFAFTSNYFFRNLIVAESILVLKKDYISNDCTLLPKPMYRIDFQNSHRLRVWKTYFIGNYLISLKITEII